MKVILFILFLFAAFSSFGRGSAGHSGSVHVNGYVRHDGTLIQSHFRTAPDGTKLNNWSHEGNINPYTGKVGTNTDVSPNYGKNGYYSSSVHPYYGGFSNTPTINYSSIINNTEHDARTAADFSF